MAARIGGAANLTSLLIGSIRLCLQNTDVIIPFRLSLINQEHAWDGVDCVVLASRSDFGHNKGLYILRVSLLRFFDPFLKGFPTTVTVCNSRHGAETPLGIKPAGLAAVSSRTSQHRCSRDSTASCQLRNFDGSYFIFRNAFSHRGLEC